MYLTILSLAIALTIGIGTWLLGAGWFGGSLLGLLAFVATWLLGVRRLRKYIGPGMAQVQRQVEQNMLRPALKTLTDMLRYAAWIPLLKGQIYAQMGVLAHHMGERDEALGYLARAGRRSAEAQMLLASIRYREGQIKDALARLEMAEALNRKDVLLHNVHAWLLVKEGKVDEAIKVLNRLLKKDPTSETARDNLLRLQNGNRMNMKGFGVPWYALGFERPPAEMGDFRHHRKGFRQAPKRRR